jgi:lipopolysaccharide heptosyltransferase I
MTRLLVVRLGSLGDLVHTLPAVAAIRRAHSTIEIDWLVDAVHVEFLDLVPVISAVVPLTNRSARAWLDVRGRLRARQYDVALDFQGLIKSAALARLSGATRVIGFDRPSLREGAAAPFYSERVTVGEGLHVIEKNLRLAAAVGAESRVLEFPIRPVPSAALDAVRANVVGPFALINGGAAWPNKRWPPDRLGRTAAWLRERHGLSSIALWGPHEESMAAEIAQTSGGAAVVAPATRLADLVAFAREARLMISGDTGPTHIAAAVGTPVVALFGPTDPRRNGPWVADDVTLSRYEGCDCHYERRCRRDASRWCLASITEEELRAAIDTRLERVRSRDV